MTSMESLSDAMKQRLNRHGIDQAISSATDLETAKRVLPPYATPKKLREGVLWVEIDTPANAYFFREDSENIIERINAAIGKPIVTNLKIRISYS